MLRTEARALCVLGEYSVFELCPQLLAVLSVWSPSKSFSWRGVFKFLWEQKEHCMYTVSYWTNGPPWAVSKECLGSSHATRVSWSPNLVAGLDVGKMVWKQLQDRLKACKSPVGVKGPCGHSFPDPGAWGGGRRIPGAPDLVIRSSFGVLAEEKVLVFSTQTTLNILFIEFIYLFVCFWDQTR